MPTTDDFSCNSFLRYWMYFYDWLGVVFCYPIHIFSGTCLNAHKPLGVSLLTVQIFCRLFLFLSFVLFQILLALHDNGVVIVPIAFLTLFVQRTVFNGGRV